MSWGVLIIACAAVCGLFSACAVNLHRYRTIRCRQPGMLRYVSLIAGTAFAFALVATWWLWVVVTPHPTAHTPLPDAAEWVLLVAYLTLAAASLVLALIDSTTHRLPNVIVLPSITVFAVLLTVAAILSGDTDALVRAGIGGALLGCGYGLLWGFGGVGFGDVKLAVLLGLALAWFGWWQLLVGTFATSVLGGSYALALVWARRARRNSQLPFGPWMLAGAWLVFSLAIH